MRMGQGWPRDKPEMAAAAPQHKAWRMLNRIFPRQFDNDYRGHWLGIALFILVIALKAMQGVNSIIMTHQVMTTADGIPVDSYRSEEHTSEIPVTFLYLVCRLL